MFTGSLTRPVSFLSGLRRGRKVPVHMTSTSKSVRGEAVFIERGYKGDGDT